MRLFLEDILRRHRGLTCLAAVASCAYAQSGVRGVLGTQGDSDLQLERINVYFNEASGGKLPTPQKRLRKASPWPYNCF